MAGFAGLGAGGAVGAAGIVGAVVVAGALAVGGYLYFTREDEATAPRAEAPAPLQAPEEATAADATTAPVAAIPSPRAPSFDTVRVTDLGATIAGRGEPDRMVRIFLDGERLTEVPISARGEFVAMLDLPPADAPRVMSLEMDGPDGTSIASEQTVLVLPRSVLPALTAAQDEAAQADTATEAPVPAPEIALLTPEAGQPAAPVDGPRPLGTSDDSAPPPPPGQPGTPQRAQPGAAPDTATGPAPVPAPVPEATQPGTEAAAAAGDSGPTPEATQ
ncbi:MAG: hypothetical protein JJU40_11685, partial [Rhodobacteraceae bacterium]|nr:hypothetical protein [Paracoccaceae bacterium]